MTNQPLNSNDLSKLLIFTMFMLPSIFFVIGIIPALFLLFGIFMTKKSKDFSHIETAVRNYKYYASIIIVGSLLFIAFCFVLYSHSHSSYPNNIQTSLFYAVISLLCAAISFLYIILVNKLLLSPLKSHSEWIVTNGIFSGRNSTSNESLDIIKCEGLRSFSVADELIKWAKLKEDGHITEQEFDDVRKKLLQKN